MDLLVDSAAPERRTYAYTGGKPFDPARPVVVFIHGALHDHSVWTLAARWFANHGTSVLALDQPAHGKSAGPAMASVEALADWALSVLDAAGVERAAWVGHSMGSLVALEAAARAPHRARRLAMVGTAYPMKVSPALLALSNEDPQAAIDRVNAWSHSGFASKPSYPGPGSWLHGANRALMQRVLGDASAPNAEANNLFAHDFALCDRYANGLEAARKVACPTSFILGRHDQMTRPADAQALADALGARVHRIDCGHSLMTEAPDALLAALRSALD